MLHATTQSVEILMLGQFYIASSEHANIWLGKMITSAEPHRIVALKEIRFGLSKNTSESITKRLQEYINIGQSLQHANITHAYCLTNGHGFSPLLVSPYFPNGNVVEYLKNHPEKTNEDKMILVKDVLKGLVYLHGIGLIHTNIHGANVLIRDNGSAVLCDIQIAGMSFSNKEHNTISSKCWWMPHERLIEGDLQGQFAPPSKSADIYSVALTISQMWTLQRPFSHICNPYKLITVLQQLKSGELGLRRPQELPVDVWEVLYDCLNVNPQLRPMAATLLERF